MINLAGVMQVLPLSFRMEEGQLNVEGKQTKSYVLMFGTSENSEVHIIVPDEFMDEFIKVVQSAKSGLKIASNLDEVDKFARGGNVKDGREQ